MFNPNTLCLDSIISPCWLNSIIPVLRLDLISFSRYLSELRLLLYSLSLITFNYLYSDVIPFTYTWKMVKYTLNHIPESIIG